MKSQTVIVALAAAFKNDRERLISTVGQLLAVEERAGNRAVAQSLRCLMQNNASPLGKMIELRHAPDGVTAIQPARQISDLVLIDGLRETIDQLRLERKYAQALADNNLRPRNKLLFHGPPGTGKTAAAEVVATTIGVPFLLVNSPLIMDSHLGDSSRNLSKVFREAAQYPCVLFFDEVDAIASSRVSGKESVGKERNAVVNSLLMQIDALPASCTLVAATNQFQFLDKAFLRRCDSLLEFALPTESQVTSYVAMLNRRHPILQGERIDIAELVGLSYAEIEIRLMNRARELVLAA